MGNNQNGEQKPIGRPAGNHESKRQQYLEMLNSGKTTTPKEQTLEYYKMVNLDGTYHLQAKFNSNQFELNQINLN